MFGSTTIFGNPHLMLNQDSGDNEVELYMFFFFSRRVFSSRAILEVTSKMLKMWSSLQIEDHKRSLRIFWVMFSLHRSCLDYDSSAIFMNLDGIQFGFANLNIQAKNCCLASLCAFFCPFLGCLSDPFKGCKRDLQIGEGMKRAGIESPGRSFYVVVRYCFFETWLLSMDVSNSHTPRISL